MADDTTGSVLSEMTPQPAANPDAQTTVNDFLDYTEFFPSDLHRSLRLIGDLDAIYEDATLNVHDLTKTYGRLPDIPASERPDPVTLRKQIALALDKAIYCRESTFAEASRLYEVAERHVRRLSIIKSKLQALPQPPSRDPTPVPVSPTALKRGYDKTPRLHIHFDSSRYVRPIADRGRKPLGRGHSRAHSDSDSDSDVGSTIDLKTPRRYNDKTPKSRPPQRVRPAGPAAISTSSALAMLSPPPPDAKPGSKFAPWFKLTEYEMAVLRKQMKKNALWTPSDTMIRRELEKKQRGHEFYEKEKARCEATGEEILDEEPYKPSAPAAATPTPVAPPASSDGNVETLQTPVEPPRDSLREDTATLNKGMKLNEFKEAKKVRRESQREQAIRDAQELEDATKKIKEAAEGLKELTFSPDVTGGRRKSSARPNTKRKRESSPTGTAETPRSQTRETSHASQDSGTKLPEPKRLRLQSSFPASTNGNGSSQHTLSTPLTGTPIEPSPLANTPVPFSESSKTTTIHIPLAPAGPGTPSVAETGSVSPALPSAEEQEKSLLSPTPTLPTATAASLRPRRESVAPAKAASPAAALLQTVKTQKTPTPAPATEPARPSLILAATRPRSARGHVPTPKAQSEEPKPNDISKPTRELRRHSIFSQSAIGAPTRASSRKKPPPKGDITSTENGSKTVTNVKRVSGSKNKKKKKTDEENEPPEDIDPDEPRYCICDDVSFGQMISCDNNVGESITSSYPIHKLCTNLQQCEKEWFHLECVGMAAKDIPGRRAKWYCPDCRKSLGTDMYGNPLVPPSLPGRRGAR
jgi:hypothetical protein